MQNRIDDLTYDVVLGGAGSGLRDNNDAPSAVEFAFRIRARHGGKN
jgi:hypothetical protein